ncbi:Oxysterol-binding protein-related protein 1C [Platanthera zijinensis]|uniref:Oxysterol-binding protein-related protein 1C n=1 Tax=Platanthera zijinensis TaxID=2320716 RepID=A0AAP0FWF0_9ASPA
MKLTSSNICCGRGGAADTFPSKKMAARDWSISLEHFCNGKWSMSTNTATTSITPQQFMETTMGSSSAHQRLFPLQYLGCKHIVVCGEHIVHGIVQNRSGKTMATLFGFAITLEELTPGLKELLPPTDSRLRPDQRFLKNGEFDMANSEKSRLEQRQRQWILFWYNNARPNSVGSFRLRGSWPIALVLSLRALRTLCNL